MELKIVWNYKYIRMINDLGRPLNCRSMNTKIGSAPLYTLFAALISPGTRPMLDKYWFTVK